MGGPEVGPQSIDVAVKFQTFVHFSPTSHRPDIRSTFL